MSEFGFKKAGKGLELPDMAKHAVEVDPMRERAAIAKGEELGFVDRGGGTVVRRNRKAQPSASVFVKGPIDIIQWFIRYTEERGHGAYWQSIQDFKDRIERAEGNPGRSTGEA